jgi:hypothetical protein
MRPRGVLLAWVLAGERRLPGGRREGRRSGARLGVLTEVEEEGGDPVPVWLS